MKKKNMALNISATNSGLTRLTFRVATINWRRNDLWKIALYLHLLALFICFFTRTKTRWIEKFIKMLWSSVKKYTGSVDRCVNSFFSLSVQNFAYRIFA